MYPFRTKHVEKLESEVREAYGTADDYAYLLSELRTKVELAYGLLWMVGCDRSTKNGNALYLARKALYEQLDKDGQARGITAARLAVINTPPV